MSCIECKAIITCTHTHHLSPSPLPLQSKPIKHPFELWLLFCVLTLLCFLKIIFHRRQSQLLSFFSRSLSAWNRVLCFTWYCYNEVHKNQQLEKTFLIEKTKSWGYSLHRWRRKKQWKLQDCSGTAAFSKTLLEMLFFWRNIWCHQWL